MTNRHRVALLRGDGIGPIVIDEALRWLHAVDAPIEFVPAPFGYQTWLDAGDALPPSTASLLRETGIALLGAATTPETGCSSPILHLRRELGLDLLVRPAAGITIVAHAFEGLYFAPEHDPPRWVVTEAGATRVLAEGFRRAKRRVTFVDKPTVLRHHAALYRRIGTTLARPGIAFEVVNADAFVASLWRDPSTYDVVCATSFVGDVLSDITAAIDGGVGTAPSLSLGPNCAVFEPVHGSAPRRAAEFPPTVDPRGAIRAAAMLLEHLGEDQRAARLRAAVAITPFPPGMITRAYGDAGIPTVLKSSGQSGKNHGQSA